MKKDLYVNGVNSSDILPEAGYSVIYDKVTGQNGGLMLDGTEEEDLLAIKAVCSFPLMPLNERKQSAFLQNLMSDKYATIYYFDPRQNAYRTAVMKWTLTETKHRGQGADGNEYWTGLTVTFRDRFNYS